MGTPALDADGAGRRETTWEQKPEERALSFWRTPGSDVPAHSHLWKGPAELLLVGAHHIGDSVEVLLSQNLFRHLWQHHAVHDGEQERVALVKKAGSCVLSDLNR